MHAPEPRLPGISVREAAIHFGTSESDIRRRIKRGEIQAESIARPGGTLLRVLIDAPGATPDPEPPSEPARTPEPLQDAPALRTALESIGSLVERNAALSDRVAELEREAGRLEGEVQARADALEWTQARLDQAQAELERVRRKRWWNPKTW